MTETMIEPQKVLNAQKTWLDNPIRFVTDFFHSKLWSKQIDVMHSVRDNARTAVKSGNTVGKSFDVAQIALWFLITHYPSKVITTAPTFNQIENIIWKEINGLVHKSKVEIGAEILKTQLKFNEEWFALGISTDEVNRFQGFHSPYLLVIIDEALGVAPEIWEAIEGLHPYRILAIGNPLSPEGNFYQAFQSPLWNKITISCLECVAWQNINGRIPGLVTEQWIKERKEEWGEKSPLYQARVLGEFPTEGTNTLIPMKYVEEARKRESQDDEDEEIRIISSDIATKHGESKTVIGYRYGHTISEIQAHQNIPATTSARIIQKLYEKKDADSNVIDSDGFGEGVADIIMSKNLGVLEFHGGYGYKAMDSMKFKNLRSQFYWVIAKKFEKGLYSLKNLPQPMYDMLKSQLCSIRVKAPDALGRIQIETKDDMRARGMVSPDFSDMLMMSEFAYFMGKMSDIASYQYKAT